MKVEWWRTQSGPSKLLTMCCAGLLLAAGLCGVGVNTSSISAEVLFNGAGILLLLASLIGLAVLVAWIIIRALGE
jgi:hypothetical protein